MYFHRYIGGDKKDNTLNFPKIEGISNLLASWLQSKYETLLWKLIISIIYLLTIQYKYKKIKLKYH